MALVIKSWSVRSNPAPGEPYVRIVGRESGLLSFLLSLVGIDATTTMTITDRHFEFERGSLSGFTRRVSPFHHICATHYGRYKPWKMLVGVAVPSFFFGMSLLFRGGWSSAFGLLVLLLGVGGALLYYYLNRELTFGFCEVGGMTPVITFKRSVIEGQEIDEDALRRIIVLVEQLMEGGGVTMKDTAMSGAPSSVRMAAPAPTSVKEVFAQTPVAIKCPSCNAAAAPEEKFCSVCGTKLR